MTYKRVDTNHGEIVAAFRRLGASVVSTAAIGNGFPDLVVGYGGLSMLVEVKTATGKLTKDQNDFWQEWTGGVRLVRNEDDVRATLETLRRWHDAIRVLG